MNPARWEQLKTLFHGALDQPPASRADWLRQACADEALRAEAQALLDAHQSGGAFLEAPRGAIDAPALQPGHQVGPYVVKGELGRGGMGIVYLAEDGRLGRTVALKALPASVAGDAVRRERLRREARAAAALTHPGIAVVYALEEIDGDLFIASEYVRGRTLRAELAAGPPDPRRAVETAIEIVRALAAAHEAGIVHRDLKPDNVLRTDEGRVKVLDFGIAQFTDSTRTQLTAAGAVLGTPAYMAPEQFAGGDVDFRTDLYAVGVLLVEMATGRHPFASGGGVAAPSLHDALKPIADRLLARDPRDRYASTRALLEALEATLPAVAAAGAHGRRRSRSETRAAAFTPLWWWEFHQGTAAIVYWLMAIPAWSARGVIGGLAGRTMFVVTLAAIIVAANLRLHRWFTSRFYPSELAWVRGRTATWVTVADWAFAAALTGSGLLVGDAREALAVLLLSFGIGSAVVFLFVEPVTERAAFRRSS
jgi:predicted Ser/Thr protein kinase